MGKSPKGDLFLDGRTLRLVVSFGYGVHRSTVPFSDLSAGFFSLNHIFGWVPVHQHQDHNCIGS